MKRTFIDTLSSHIDEQVTIKGWVHIYRDQGKMVFLDLRDMTGIVQGVVLPKSEALEIAKTLRAEFVVTVTGTVVKRPEKMIKEGVLNGDIELHVEGVTIDSPSETPPFAVNENTKEVEENRRLEYRYLDLRSERMQKNIRTRSEMIKKFREFLYGQKFIEVETPLLAAPTKEGSRDFVVPSRHQPGKFYALPQSPQQYKQLLMAGGIERYFQVARAMRDEDLRADRTFEHTQLDIEMSFMTMQEVMQLIESMVTTVIQDLGYKIKSKPFPVVSYKDSMEQYGDDKFDLRTKEEQEEGVLAFAWVTKFPMFEKTSESDDATAKGEWTFTHNPFSMPAPEDMSKLINNDDPGSIEALQYDLVCNGFEVGGGSIRAHRPEILEATYKIMGYSDEEIQESIGHMVNAFKYGAPPHGGIALGLDRLVMLLTGEENLREVQAFPMTRQGSTAVMKAPITLPTTQLQELGIIAKKQEDE